MPPVVIRKDAAAVVLDEGDFLIYEVTVQGAKANFTLTDTTDPDDPITLMSDTDAPAVTFPDVIFRRRWPRLDDVVSIDRDHVLGVVHLKGDKYTYKVTRHHANKDTVILDIDYAGEDGELSQKLLNVLQ